MTAFLFSCAHVARRARSFTILLNWTLAKFLPACWAIPKLRTPSAKTLLRQFGVVAVVHGGVSDGSRHRTQYERGIGSDRRRNRAHTRRRTSARGEDASSRRKQLAAGNRQTGTRPLDSAEGRVEWSQV